MIEQIKYVNHLNEEIVFGQSPFFIKENDLRDFVYSFSENNIVSNFRRTRTTKKIGIVTINATAEQLNNMYSVYQKDIAAEKEGKIVCGDYYYKCYIYGSNKPSYSNVYDKEFELQIVSESNTWFKEKKTVFIKASDDEMEEAEEYRKYPYGYPYGYAKSNENAVVTNNFGYACGFRFIIYGPATNPVVNVNGHMYKVTCVVLDGEYLTILSTDSDKLIYITQNDGTQVNKFANRDKTSYIFEKIPGGICDVLWDGEFAFDITLIDERGEPAWI